MAWMLGGIAGVARFCCVLQFYGVLLPLVVPGYGGLRQHIGALLAGLKLVAAVLVGTALADSVYRAKTGQAGR